MRLYGQETEGKAVRRPVLTVRRVLTWTSVSKSRREMREFFSAAESTGIVDPNVPAESIGTAPAVTTTATRRQGAFRSRRADILAAPIAL